MKLKRTTSLNDAIKRMSCGNAGAASVLALILRERPDQALPWMRLMDQHEIYGRNIFVCFSMAGQDLDRFLMLLNDGTLKSAVAAKRPK